MRRQKAERKGGRKGEEVAEEGSRVKDKRARQEEGGKKGEGKRRK